MRFRKKNCEIEQIFYYCFTTQLKVIFRNCEKFESDTPRVKKTYVGAVFAKILYCPLELFYLHYIKSYSIFKFC